MYQEKLRIFLLQMLKQDVLFLKLEMSLKESDWKITEEKLRQNQKEIFFFVYSE